MSDDRFVIHGGRPLSGTVHVSGSKNAAVAIIPATILAKGTFTLYNVPDISDITDLINILEYLGARCEYSAALNSLRIDTRGVENKEIDYALGGSIRASYYFWGAMLARFGFSRVCPPGGCKFADRPFDMHISAFEGMGAKCTVGVNIVEVDGRQGIHGTDVSFATVSVGATINTILAAVGCNDTTVIRGAAKEPHVVDVANFLSLMGADIVGAGTDTIIITGGKELHAVEYTIIPDQIEAGTFLAAAAATRGTLTVCDAEPVHLESIISILRYCHCKITIDPNTNDITISAPDSLRSAVVTAEPHPGLPTDMQAMLSVMFTTCSGGSVIRDTVFPDRVSYVEELKLLGADIEGPKEGQDYITVDGVSHLVGATVTAQDLRAGAALVIAGLVAEGETIVTGTKYVDRGYEDFVGKLRGLGADIERV